MAHPRTQIYDSTLDPPLPLNVVGPFVYEDPDHPSLKRLREQEHPDDVAGSGSTFERLMRLRNWVATQWDFSTPEPYPPWDAVTILDWIRNRKTGGFCGIYAIVFGQAAISLGLRHMRFVELGHERNPICHFLTEVWHPEQKKWVVLDPVQGIGGTFTRGDEYLSALDLHEARMTGQIEGIQYHPPPEPPRARRHKRYTLEDWLHSYYYVRWVWRQNFLTEPPPYWNINNTFDRYYDCVEWRDSRTTPWEESNAPLFPTCPPHVPLCWRRANDASLIYATPAED